MIEAVVNQPGYRRQRLAREAADLRAAGLPAREIAEALGISRSYAAELIADPSGTKAKQRKQRYAQPCVDCGEPTSGGEGRREEPRCVPCAAARAGLENMIWTPERVIAAIQEWVALYGDPPAIPDWSPYHARALHDEERARRWERADGRWPWYTVVFNRFGSWNEGLRAAGFEPRAPHGGGGNQHRRRTRREVVA